MSVRTAIGCFWISPSLPEPSSWFQSPARVAFLDVMMPSTLCRIQRAMCICDFWLSISGLWSVLNAGAVWTVLWECSLFLTHSDVVRNFWILESRCLGIWSIMNQIRVSRKHSSMSLWKRVFIYSYGHLCILNKLGSQGCFGFPVGKICIRIIIPSSCISRALLYSFVKLHQRNNLSLTPSSIV